MKGRPVVAACSKCGAQSPPTDIIGGEVVWEKKHAKATHHGKFITDSAEGI